MFSNQITVPPVDAVMPAYNNTVAWVNLAIYILVFLWAIREARRSESVVPILAMIGGSIAALQEPIYDIVGMVWYPHFNSVSYERAFNVSPALWLIPNYGWYIGGQTVLMLKFIRRGLNMSELWMYYGLFWLVDIGLEVPALNLHVYMYYGVQPFKFMGFPMWMAMTNSLMPIIGGSILYSLRDILKGPRAFLTLALMPMITCIPQFAIGWPVWLTLNSDAGMLGRDAAALVSLGFSIMVVYLISTKICVTSAKVNPAYGALKTSRV